MGNITSPCAWPDEGTIVFSLKEQDTLTKNELVRLGFTILVVAGQQARHTNDTTATCESDMPQQYMQHYGRMSVPDGWEIVAAPSHHESFVYWTVNDANGLPRVKVGGKVSDHDYCPEVHILTEEQGKAHLDAMEKERLEREEAERLKEARKHDPVAIFEDRAHTYIATVRKIRSDFPWGGGERFQSSIDNTYSEMVLAYAAVPTERKAEVGDLPRKVHL